MKAIFLFVLIIFYKGTIGQETLQTGANGSLTALGYISVPSLMSLQVETNQNNVRFQDPLDFKTGKYYSGFLDMRVVSTQPWLISMKTIAPNFTPLTQSASPDMPVGVMRLKKAGTNNWISLSSTTQTLLPSENNQIVNSYTYDALFELGWKYRSGNYSTTILFTLTPQ